jgi:N-acetylmuramoyl-L-alanine amidase
MVADSITYVAVYEFAQLMNGSFFWKEETKKMVMKLGVYQITFTGENRVVVANNRPYYLKRPVKYCSGTLYIAAPELAVFMGSVLSARFTWDEGTRTLKARTNLYNVANLEISEQDGQGTITLSLSEKLAYEKTMSDPSWLHLNFAKGYLDPKIGQAKAWGAIKEIKTYQFDEAAQVSFLFAPAVKNFETQWDDQKFCLRIHYGKGVAKPESIVRNETIGLIDCIVIDPGHGGKDPGAIGPSGLQEKEVVLDVAQRLAELVKKNTSMKVIMTRDNDTFIPLGKRTQLANEKGAKLFISIHANASSNRKAGGYQTFFLAQEKNDEARLVAAMENSAIKFELSADETREMTNLDFIMWDICQNEFLKESEDFAIMIQGEQAKRLELNNRGIDQAGFYVLKGAFMPSVLVEIAFISNTYEEKFLQKRKSRQAIAEALFNSIKQFKKKYESSL